MARGSPVTAADDALLRDIAIRAVEAQPLGYLRAVLGGLILLTGLGGVLRIRRPDRWPVLA